MLNKERNGIRAGKNGNEGAFLAGEVIIHVDRDTGKESCFKTRVETDAASENKARRCSANLR